MTEKNKNEVTIDGNKVIVIPEGFTIQSIGGNESDTIKPCSHCGASVNPFMSNCDSCGQGHPFLTFKADSERSQPDVENTDVHTPGIVKINVQEMQGVVHADSIDVESGSVVGTLTAPDITIGNKVSSASTIGIKVNTGRQAHINHLTLQTGSIGFNSRIDTLTIVEGQGNVRIGLLSQIGTLRINDGIAFHKPIGVKIGTIEQGKFTLKHQFPQTKQ